MPITRTPVDFDSSIAGNEILLSSNRTGIIFTYPKFSAGSAVADGEIIVGFGIRSAVLEQNFNTTQEGSVGFVDIETVMHGVQSNTFSLEVMMLRAAAMEAVGAAPYGIQAFAAPALTANIFDADIRSQTGQAAVIAIAKGLNLRGQRISIQHGSTVGQSVTYAFDRLVPGDKAWADKLLTKFAEQYPEQFQSFQAQTTYSIPVRTK